MPIDALFLTAVTRELTDTLIGCRVDKVQQPERDTLLLSLRSPGTSCRLLLSASSNHPRIHLTEEAMENPAQPPMFCMLLRKHLTGGRIVSLTQPPMERLVDLCLDCTDEMGEPVQKHLVLELMGRNSNLILLGGDGRILDCMRRVDFEMSEQRQVLPGLFYRLPPAQGKLDPLAAEPETLAVLLRNAADEKKLDQWLLDTFGGLSPLVCRELSFELLGSVDVLLGALDVSARDALAAALSERFAQYRSGAFTPVLLLQDGAPKDFSCIPIRQYEGYREERSAPSFSKLLDGFYSERDRTERMRQKTQALRKTLTNLTHRTARKLELQRKELAATYDREHLRRLGDIVTANLYAIRRGQTTLHAVDFYDPDMREIEIPLSPAISPQQNAAKFYKDYQKAKNAERILTEQIANGEQELAYLESVLDALTRVECERDIQEIRTELADGRYLRETGQKKRMKAAPSKPMEFRSSSGLTILVGRNNRENDLLTTKLASKGDLWLHTQKIHGSHVILVCSGTEPDDQSVTEAAQLAAWFSQARDGQNIPVDATAVKNVKKPAGAKPGMVVYYTYRTVYVTPDAALAQALKAR